MQPILTIQGFLNKKFRYLAAKFKIRLYSITAQDEKKITK
jgi:hypothetical protein